MNLQQLTELDTNVLLELLTNIIAILRRRLLQLREPGPPADASQVQVPPIFRLSGFPYVVQCDSLYIHCEPCDFKSACQQHSRHG